MSPAERVGASSSTTATWTQPISVLEFLRDVGKHVTVNQMLARESIKMRINSEHGISFTEFSYMLLQANDYLWLHENLGCTIQIGGSDQWGNIIAGVDLIRRKTGDHVHAFSWPLLTAADGSQTRQDHRGPRLARRRQDQPVPVPPALDADRRRRDRGAAADVLAPPGGRDRGLLAGTNQAPHRRLAQRALADEMVTLVHGAEAAHAAAEAADLLFSADPTAASASALEALAAEIPSSAVDATRWVTVATLVGAGLARSNGDARRNLAQGSYSVNGVTIPENSPAASRNASTAGMFFSARARRRTISSRLSDTWNRGGLCLQARAVSIVLRLTEGFDFHRKGASGTYAEPPAQADGPVRA